MLSSPLPDEVVLTRRREIGDNIRDARRARQLSQEAVALAAGIERPTLVRIEAAQASARIDTLIRIAAVLDIELSELVRRK
ncbi:helix-turn-helix transcriptional regulator [Streptomyces zaomyceticus]|uniref:helix-turn-helix domain-containing protein n=1 Tax=Streptomyces zaomyceticus TaxID=68286 RepID=UPI002E137739|nr:helix-turn-helix domain-containing protein [Streptomyces zaomyceticus]